MTKIQPSQWLLYSKGVASGGAAITTSQDGGGYADTTESGGGYVDTTSSDVAVAWTLPGDFAGSLQTVGTTSEEGLHNHGIPHGTGLKTVEDGAEWFSTSGYHLHSVKIREHDHPVRIDPHSHRVSIPDHDHEVHIPSHSHQIELQKHNHELEYGIFEGPMPTAVEVKIDGNLLPGLDLNEDGVDIIPYLAKDRDGKVTRGWHEITITPNDLGRISANVSSQIFVQSRGGGNY